MKNIALAITLILSLHSYSQQTICATDLVNDTTGLAEMNSLIEDAQIFQSNAVLTIPLVFHVMHVGELYGGGSNITDEQIQSAVDALNADFRNLNGESVDIEIEFCLATSDPFGNPTDGINRVDASGVPLYVEEGISAGSPTGANELAIKDLSRWDRDEYYNIWIVNEIQNSVTPTSSGCSGVQGYAYFPNGSASRDGTVIYFGRVGTVGDICFDADGAGSILTHEIGHALFLYHVFQGGCDETNCETQGDRVCDTSPSGQSFTCSTLSCGGTGQDDNNMSYACLEKFTDGQRTRMRNALLISRASLLGSAGCGTPTACQGDINQDGVVDINDFIMLNSMYGSLCGSCPEDINGDGVVGIDDFIIFNSAFGNTCGELAPAPTHLRGFDALGRKL